MIGANVFQLSVVVPAYNERERLPKTMASLLSYLNSRGSDFEIIVVDDGSSDDTSGLIDSLKTSWPNVRLIALPENRGKGYAVRQGIMAAAGKWILYCDADGAAPIEEIQRLEAGFRNGISVVIGSRALASKETLVKTLWYRKALGRVFNKIANWLVVPGIEDTQCGFKMFEREAARDIFSRAKADRFSFDVEVLFLAKKLGYGIDEVAINWTNVPGSKVDVVWDSLAMARDLVWFRLLDLRGDYDKV